MAEIRLFGFSLGKKPKENAPVPDEKLKSFTPPVIDDGAVTVQTGGHFGTYVDIDGSIRNEVELITRYRQMSLQPELESAIDEIVNEAIVMDETGKSVDLITENLELSESVKKKILQEFNNILKLLDFSNHGSDVFRRWYIDGRLNYHVIIDEKQPSKGIQELRYIDPRNIRKVREIEKVKDAETGMELIKSVKEYYLYNVRGIHAAFTNLGMKIATDSIIYVPSGHLDAHGKMALSYLHKAIKPLNNLRMVEDAVVIYRLARAPERRAFYIDVGNLPKVKAEQYIQGLMNRYRNKIVYDSATGEVRDDRRHQAMLEDFWLPRREGARGTEISTISGGQNLGNIEDIQYFEKKLYRALSLPASRLEQGQGFSLGRSTEISRDEIRFGKFVEQLRRKFSVLFDSALRLQLSLKGICSVDDWDIIKHDIYYDFLKDVEFAELKQAEILRERVATLQVIDPYVGVYFSREWVRRNVLMQTEEEEREMQKQIDKEALEEPPVPNGVEAIAQQQAMAAQGFGGQPGAGGGMPQQPRQPGASQYQSPDELDQQLLSTTRLKPQMREDYMDFLESEMRENPEPLNITESTTKRIKKALRKRT